MERHELVIEPAAEQTLGRCTCGEWSREADLEIVAVTGRSREDTLRSAHAQHARGATATPTTLAGPALAGPTALAGATTQSSPTT